MIHLVRVILGTEYGDADLDGDVDLQDYNRLALGFGTNTGWAGGDFSGNGIVNSSDYLTLKTYFGFKVPAQGLPVPEPASTAIMGLLALAAIRTKR